MKQRKCSLTESMKAPPRRWFEISILYLICIICGY